MSKTESVTDSGDERLNQIIAEYLDAVQSRQAPDRAQLLRQHPDFADELKEFFTDHDQMNALAEPVRMEP